MGRSASRMMRTALAAILCVAFAAGCRTAETVVLAPIPVKPATPYRPQTSNPSSFDLLVMAGDGMSIDCKDMLKRTEFTPGMRADILKRGADRIAAAERAANQLPQMPEAWSSAGATEIEAGWRLIGHALIWQMEDAIAEQNWPLAVSKCLTLTRFGTVLMAGQGEELSLGVVMAGEARALIAPELRRMEAGTLDALADQMTAILNATPPAEAALDREQEQALRQVQDIQESYQNKTLDSLVTHYGRTVRPTVQYLKRLKAAEVKGFFDGFVAELRTLHDLSVEESHKPVKDWEEEPEVLKSGSRPWKRLTNQIYSPMRVILQQRARQTARMRMLILSARIEAQIKRGGKAPTDLAKFPDELKVDPYSGELFAYSVEEADYRLYSVGENGERDGGVTDESGVEPDLVLERPAY